MSYVACCNTTKTKDVKLLTANIERTRSDCNTSHQPSIGYAEPHLTANWLGICGFDLATKRGENFQGVQAELAHSSGVVTRCLLCLTPRLARRACDEGAVPAASF